MSKKYTPHPCREIIYSRYTLGAAAKTLGVTKEHLSSVLTGRRTPGPKLEKNIRTLVKDRPFILTPQGVFFPSGYGYATGNEIAFLQNLGRHKPKDLPAIPRKQALRKYLASIKHRREWGNIDRGKIVEYVWAELAAA